MRDKVVVITGASKGIGAELARQLAAKRAKLVLAARDLPELEKVAEQCRQAGAGAITVRADVTVDPDCAAIMTGAALAYGGIDVLVNNAGATMWARFEEIEDVSILDRIRGEPQASRESQASSISHSSVLGPDHRQPDHAFAVLNRLTQKAAMRMRKAGYYCTRFGVGLRYLDGSHWHSEMRLVDTQDTRTFLHALEKLWEKRPKDRRTILKVEMALADLMAESEHTGSLFAAEERSKSLYSALDKLNARFGKQAVYFASAHKARDRGGMHIAFNHIPDPETDK